MGDRMKYEIIWNGPVFQPTGYGCFARPLLKELSKKAKLQILDHYSKEFDGDGFFKKCFVPIDRNNPNSVSVTYNQPHFWHPLHKNHFGFLLWEGDSIPKAWVNLIHSGCVHLLVPSTATKNMLFSNGVRVPISVVNGGVNTEVFRPVKKGVKEDVMDIDWKGIGFNKRPFVFLYLNSWSGRVGDRKGGDKVIRAFCEEFKNNENVTLYFKNSTFWGDGYDINEAVQKLGVPGLDKRPPIITDSNFVAEKFFPKLYRSADCFVSATNGESWGLTLLEAMSSGLPIIVPKNREAGYFDFVISEGTFFVDTFGKVSGDPVFFEPNNRFPDVSIDSLRKQMRKAFETKKEVLKKMGVVNRNRAKEFTWDKSANMLLEAVKMVIK
jgi:glycosyltransferase involved in cell wall biosynthesis